MLLVVKTRALLTLKWIPFRSVKILQRMADGMAELSTEQANEKRRPEMG